MFHRQQIAPISANGFNRYADWVIGGYLPNTLRGNQMHIDTDYILKSINDTSHVLYRNPAEQADRLAWEVGALSSKIREMAALLQFKANQLEELKKELQ
jgi:hypothetical protein